jgi:hypothetical protein
MWFQFGIAHSCLNAMSGSTLVARRAGSQHASNEIAVSNNAAMPNVSGSVVVTPNNSRLNQRVNTSEAISPELNPTCLAR